MSYQLQVAFGRAVSVLRDGDASIPFDVSNRDCRKFIRDWQAGASVMDANSNPVSYSEEAAAALGLA